MLVPTYTVDKMVLELSGLLQAQRRSRDFRVKQVLAEKVRAINGYFRTHRLSGAVIGVSGGIDSAVTLGLINRAKMTADSPIKQVIAISLPFTVDQGATNQETARSKAQDVANAWTIPCATVDLGSTLTELRASVQKQIGFDGSPWADGQLVSYLRTPTLYYMSALLTSHGFPAIVCGTTNRDEGSYLGFFGKASDGMVDLQIISDLHKSEVYLLGEELGVPKSILTSAPTGDVFDGKTHLEMIGAPYDFIELYTSWLTLPTSEQSRMLTPLSDEARCQFEEWGERVERMHEYNAHKYAGGNPSIHLDVLPRAVPGGWRDEGSFRLSAPKRKLVGEFDLGASVPLSTFASSAIDPRPLELPVIDESVLVLDGFLSGEECAALVEAVTRQKNLPVGRNGILKDYRAGHDPVGSYRASAFSPELAQLWWQRVRPFLPPQRRFNDYARTDWCQHQAWEPVGLNPALRFISYETGGELVVHYDAGFDPGDGEHHTLMSLVLYLTDCDPFSGGATRFIRDRQLELPYAQRDFSDWDREAHATEVLASISPVRGRALLFDHRLLHDSQPWQGAAPKVIIRTDIMFRRIRSL